MAYVYVLASSVYGVFYVGKGSGDRITTHAYEARGKKEHVTPASQFIRTTWNQGHKVIFRKIADRLSDLQALELETVIIEQYGYTQLVNHPYHKHRNIHSHIVSGDGSGRYL